MKELFVESVNYRKFTNARGKCKSLKKVNIYMIFFFKNSKFMHCIVDHTNNHYEQSCHKYEEKCG